MTRSTQGAEELSSSKSYDEIPASRIEEGLLKKIDDGYLLGSLEWIKAADEIQEYIVNHAELHNEKLIMLQQISNDFFTIHNQLSQVEGFHIPEELISCWDKFHDLINQLKSNESYKALLGYYFIGYLRRINRPRSEGGCDFYERTHQVQSWHDLLKAQDDHPEDIAPQSQPQIILLAGMMQNHYLCLKTFISTAYQQERWSGEKDIQIEKTLLLLAFINQHLLGIYPQSNALIFALNQAITPLLHQKKQEDPSVFAFDPVEQNLAVSPNKYPPFFRYWIATTRHTELCAEQYRMLTKCPSPLLSPTDYTHVWQQCMQIIQYLNDHIQTPKAPDSIQKILERYIYLFEESRCAITAILFELKLATCTFIRACFYQKELVPQRAQTLQDLCEHFKELLQSTDQPGESQFISARHSPNQQDYASMLIGKLSLNIIALINHRSGAQRWQWVEIGNIEMLLQLPALLDKQLRMMCPDLASTSRNLTLEEEEADDLTDDDTSSAGTPLPRAG